MLTKTCRFLLGCIFLNNLIKINKQFFNITTETSDKPLVRIHPVRERQVQSDRQIHRVLRQQKLHSTQRPLRTVRVIHVVS